VIFFEGKENLSLCFVTSISAMNTLQRSLRDLLKAKSFELA
jgi:hypothetical protein